jgi:N-acetylglucosaminyl-diphospho-decaprenol L-rhamnosyltransferase
MSRQKIIIILINYGTLGFVRNLVSNFLASLPLYPKLRIDWIIADAEDIADENAEIWHSEMKREFKDKKGNHFHFYKIPNQGFAANANLGFRLFKDEQEPEFVIHDSDLVLLLNPDTILYWSNLEKAIAFMNSHPEASVAGMSLTNPKGQPEKWGHSLVFPSLKFFFGYKRFSRPTYSQEPTKVAWASGGAMIIKNAWWQRLRGLDGNFFFYFEDVDFCRRTYEAGGKVYFLPQAMVGHLRGGSQISIYRRKKHFYAAEARYFHLYQSPTEYLLLRLLRFPYKVFYFSRCYFAPSFWSEKFRGTREVINFERGQGYPRLSAFKKGFLGIPYLKELWSAVIAINLVILGAAIWAKFYLFSPLVLHYNSYLGIDVYGDSTSFFMFFLLGIMISLLNFLLGLILFFSRRFTPFVILLPGITLASLIILSIAMLNLLMVNS